MDWTPGHPHRRCIADYKEHVDAFLPYANNVVVPCGGMGWVSTPELIQACRDRRMETMRHALLAPQGLAGRDASEGSWEAWRQRSEACSRKGHRYFDAFLPLKEAPGNATFGGGGAWGFTYLGICAPASCSTWQSVFDLLPFYKRRFPKLPMPPLMLLKTWAWAPGIYESTTLQRGLVKPIAEPPLLNAEGVLVPALALLLSESPASMLKALNVSAHTYGLRGVKLDFGAMPELGSDGKLQVPQGVSSILIDVGANRRTEFAALVAADPSVLVIVFEPLPPLYAEHRSWLDEQPPSVARRIWLLPLAVAEESGLAALHTTELGGCSSLCSLKGDALWTPSMLECGREIGVNIVMQMPLSSIIRHLPFDVDYLKVDAQGADLEVVLSAGDSISRVPRIKIEVQHVEPGDLTLRYTGQRTKREVIDRLADLGFVLHTCVPVVREIREEDCSFLRPGVDPKHFFQEGAG